jgi:hypothetical protein
MEIGEFLIGWSARLAMLLLFLGFSLRVGPCQRTVPAWVSRWVWTCACTVFLFHVAVAFHFAHGWSHQAAYAATARQTKDATGVDWGGGLYANYAFAIVWLVDVAWWWIAPKTFLVRNRALTWAINGFLAFMAFNASVVFAHGAMRWTALVASLLLLAILIHHLGRRYRTSR